jgi:2-C-methyl-D-erythritol 2,4-cyclodiphosphate synthase
MEYRTGLGYDLHRLKEGRKLTLGGIDIPFDKGLDGHSDADVLIHALIDAMLGSIAAGDIGQHFPPDDPQFKNISSTKLLTKVKSVLAEHHYRIVNVDSVIIAEQPKLRPYITQMQQNLARILDVKPEQISIKATTTEGLDSTGQGKAIAAQAIVLVKKL